MAVYGWCKYCATKSDYCQNQNGHRAQRHIVWRVDVQPGGRGYRRIRETRLTKELAEARERELLVEFQRGQLSLTKQGAMTFEQAADEWIGRPRSTTNSDAARSERYRVGRFKRKWGKRPLRSLSYADLEADVQERQQAGRAVGTINRDVTVAQSILNYCARKNYVQQNPFKDFKDLASPNIRIRWLSTDEIQHLYRAALEYGDAALADVIIMAVNTGFRKGNLERLTLLDMRDGVITATRTKSGKPYDVPMTEAVRTMLVQRYNDRSAPGRLLDLTNLTKRFRAVSKHAGLYAGSHDQYKVTLHTLRHTFAAHYLKRGGDIYRLAKLLGHSSVRMVEQVYGHIGKDDIAAQASLVEHEIENIPGIFGRLINDTTTSIPSESGQNI